MIPLIHAFRVSKNFLDASLSMRLVKCHNISGKVILTTDILWLLDKWVYFNETLLFTREENDFFFWKKLTSFSWKYCIKIAAENVTRVQQMCSSIGNHITELNASATSWQGYHGHGKIKDLTRLDSLSRSWT